MFHIALFEPCIPPNTGNIIRLAANNGCTLHLIEPLGFDLDEKKLRRAGLDYREFAELKVHKDYWAFKEHIQNDRVFACTTRGTRSHSDVSFEPGDVLLFGAETHGLSEEVHASIPEDMKIRIPMLPESRSLNLSNSVAIISYEAWRQNGYSNS